MRRYLKEDQVKVEYDSKLFKRLLKYMLPYTMDIIVIFLLLFAIIALSLAGPYIIKLAVDGPLRTGDVSELGILALLFLGTLLGSTVPMFFQMLLTQKVGQGIMHSLRTELFANIQNKNISYFHKSRIGGLITRIVGDVDVLTELFSYGMISMFANLCMVAGIIGILFWLNPRFAMFTFIVLPPLVPFSIFFRNRIRKCFREIRGKMSSINAFLQEHIVGIEVTKLFSREEINDVNFDKINGAYLSSYLLTIFYYSIFFPIMELVGTLTLTVILWYGGGEIFSGKVSFGVMIAFIEYTQKLFRPVKELIEKYNIIQSGMAASERIFEILDDTSEEDNIYDGESFNETIETIGFEDVSFHYREDQPVLKNISCTIKRGEKIAIVGPTGAGKTTFINIICRFFDPVSGRLTLNGKDASLLKKSDLRSRIGLVLQEPFLFSGTLKKNITLGNKAIDDEIIERAISITGVDKIARKLKGGINGEFEEKGANISMGERQLVSFAQALVHNPEVLILDEATAHIDSHSEHMIKEAMDKMGKGRTMITIAHRFSTITGADRILVFWKGELLEQGTHEELMSSCDVYKKLYELQYSKEHLEETL